ncbi:MAG: hypothetical protein J2P33_21865, partial [Actinobacteria bacterium]|nr:hypothetical protein [Actinomycetota bacterium]
ARGGDLRRLGQLRCPQRCPDRGGLGGDVAAAGALERRADLRVLRAISEGWPAVLASLKTLLEPGSSLRTS